MKTITTTQDELKKFTKEAFIEVLTNKKNLIEDIIINAFEDIGLGIAMEKGKTGKYISGNELKKILNEKIKNMQ